jgi:hypothetical protein
MWLVWFEKAFGRILMQKGAILHQIDVIVPLFTAFGGNGHIYRSINQNGLRRSGTKPVHAVRVAAKSEERDRFLAQFAYFPSHMG